MSAPLIATYRVQLNPGFRFDDAASIAAYLAELGVSHLYSSPYLQAAPGSTHGYDVVDHTRVNQELGGEAGHARLCDALRCAGLGQVLDVVPNHMAIGSSLNRWWWDVLENGPASRYALYFDVDWDLRRRLLAELKGLTPEHVLARSDEGLPKLFLIQKALAFRRRIQLDGPYEPLFARGRRANHVVAFSRGGAAFTVVPRLVLGLRGGWEDTTLDLPPKLWRNELTGDDLGGGSVLLQDVLARFPVALLSAL